MCPFCTVLFEIPRFTRHLGPLDIFLFDKMAFGNILEAWSNLKGYITCCKRPQVQSQGHARPVTSPSYLPSACKEIEALADVRSGHQTLSLGWQLQE